MAEAQIWLRDGKREGAINTLCVLICDGFSCSSEVRIQVWRFTLSANWRTCIAIWDVFTSHIAVMWCDGWLQLAIGHYITWCEALLIRYTWIRDGLGMFAFQTTLLRIIYRSDFSQTPAVRYCRFCCARSRSSGWYQHHPRVTTLVLCQLCTSEGICSQVL
jgi:hypothetical protein